MNELLRDKSLVTQGFWAHRPRGMPTCWRLSAVPSLATPEFVSPSDASLRSCKEIELGGISPSLGAARLPCGPGGKASPRPIRTTTSSVPHFEPSIPHRLASAPHARDHRLA